jgi:exodeoxyribonuclease VII small subunit
MPAPRTKQSFEELYKLLEEKVSLLEQGGLSLDDSLSAYEEAVTYAQRCQQLLDRAELRITRLRETMSGGPGGEPGEADEEPFEAFEDDEPGPEPI